MRSLIKRLHKNINIHLGNQNALDIVMRQCEQWVDETEKNNMAKSISECCYLCGAPAADIDHCPPKCFFPVEFRHAALRIPSCKEHNGGESQCDETTLDIMTKHCWTNQIGNRIFLEKVIKNYQRSKRKTSKFLHSAVKISPSDGPFAGEACMHPQDRDTFERTMRKIGYGVFYHHFCRRWMRELYVASSCFVKEDLSFDPEWKDLMEVSAMLDTSPDKNYYGSCPEIFKYWFIGEEGNDNTVMRLVFYEGIDVYLFPQPEILEPSLDLPSSFYKD